MGNPSAEFYSLIVFALIAGAYQAFVYIRGKRPKSPLSAIEARSSEGTDDALHTLLDMLSEERESRRIFEQRRNDERAIMLAKIEEIQRELTACLSGQQLRKPSKHLSAEDRQQIKSASGSHAAVGRRFGVSASTVARIRKTSLVDTKD